MFKILFNTPVNIALQCTWKLCCVCGRKGGFARITNIICKYVILYWEWKIVGIPKLLLCSMTSLTVIEIVKSRHFFCGVFAAFVVQDCKTSWQGSHYLITTLSCVKVPASFHRPIVPIVQPVLVPELSPEWKDEDTRQQESKKSRFRAFPQTNTYSS